MACSVKRYKRNGEPCGHPSCRRHRACLSEEALNTLARRHSEEPSAPIPTGWVLSASQWIEPGPLSYTAFAPLLLRLQQPNPVWITEVINYVYTQNTWKGLGLGLGLDSASSVASFFLACHRIVITPSYHRALCCFQTRWRWLRRRPRPRPRPRSSLTAANALCPFTMEALDQMSDAQRWFYKDSHGTIYGFHAPTLYHYTLQHTALNPYTREPIPEASLEDLHRHLQTLSESDRQNPFAVVWRTPRDAFADILHLYENEGFYTDIQWFLDLNPSQIIYVFRHLHHSRPPLPPELLEEYQESLLEARVLEDPEHGALFLLAQWMRDWVQMVHTMKFHYMCRLFHVLSRVSRPLHDALPSWVSLGARAPPHEE